MRVIVAGWFSFEHMGATAGDLAVRDLVAGWLSSAQIAHDVAVAPPFAGGVAWDQVDPADYTHAVFVCGPFGNGPPVDAMLERFKHCRWFGLDLSMLQKLEDFNPFEALWERDSDRATRPDLAFIAPHKPVPVVGVVRVHPQKEYGKRGLHEQANQKIEHLLSRHDCVRWEIDTRLDENLTNLRTAEEVESAIARVDCVVTTRLHGTVLALKHGVPALAIDPIAGGAKITLQTKTLGWPHCYLTEEADDARLDQAFNACLSEDGKTRARACSQKAAEMLSAIQSELIDAMRATPGGGA
jgi:hypothetical protein